ncbi:type II toxin-antitoxin system ParD family antitoxin [Minwuia sp.]|uniref:type II toxin-antitoxin system ParD family antitoxin n=1 Tax=Minwuia sp. TaxID=2493630 RepID=UPI003A8E969F
MATMNVSLPDEMREWVEQQAKSGRYSNASDYVRDLIRHDQDAHGAGGWTEEEIWAELEPAFEDFEAGRSKPAEEVFERLINKYSAMARERA